MTQSRPGEALSRGRVVRWILIFALVAVTLALVFALGALKRAEARVAELQLWQTSILRQLEGAGSSSDRLMGDGLTAEEGTQVLADLISSRDTALEMLTVPVPYAVDAPARPPNDLRPAEAPRKSSSNTIPNLLQRESAGTAAEDVTAVDRDSQAPWAGWK